MNPKFAIEVAARVCELRVRGTSRGEVFIARNREELRAAFADHELIFSLGIGSIMNVPVMLHGRCRGIVNLSHDAGHYGETDIPPARLLAGLLAPVFG